MGVGTVRKMTGKAKENNPIEARSRKTFLSRRERSIFIAQMEGASRRKQTEDLVKREEYWVLFEFCLCA